ncbi:MAG TPA: transcription antitermination factor NusB [Actinomycetota bacterium]
MAAPAFTHPRTTSRRRALDILFAADVSGVAAAGVLASESDVDKAARAIVEGVVAHADEIDGLIRGYADRWALERMPVVDRNLLRIGLYEILHEPSVPAGAAVNDAVELAKMYSTEDSGRFVNGMLARASREHPAR